MDSHAQIEIGFWRNLYRQLGHEGFLAQRKVDWEDFEKNLPELADFLREGEGKTVLEVGTGLVSPLEFADGKAEVTAIDPLMDAYNDTVELQGRPVRYLKASGEAIPFPPAEDLRHGSPKDSVPTESRKGTDLFDAVVCLNVIDHTPNPGLMLQEMKRVLKPGGKLFFEINFDAALSPAHYGIWNEAITAESMKDWKLEVSRTDYRQEHNQTRFWAVYVNA